MKKKRQSILFLLVFSFIIIFSCKLREEQSIKGFSSDELIHIQEQILNGNYKNIIKELEEECKAKKSMVNYIEIINGDYDGYIKSIESSNYKEETKAKAYARIYNLKDQPEKALEILRKYYDEDNKCLLDTYYLLGDSEKCFEIINNMEEGYRKNIFLGQLYFLEDDFQNSKKSFQNAITELQIYKKKNRKKKSDIERYDLRYIYFFLYQIALKEGDNKKAKNYWNKFQVKIHPTKDYWVLHYKFGEIVPKKIMLIPLCFYY